MLLLGVRRLVGALAGCDWSQPPWDARLLNSTKTSVNPLDLMPRTRRQAAAGPKRRQGGALQGGAWSSHTASTALGSVT
jgi:hypothetical protein